MIGIGPAVVGLRVAAESAFGGGRREPFGIRERRMHQGMMLAQVVAAAVLLLVSGGIVTALRRLNHSSTGIDSRGVVIARLMLPEDAYPNLAVRNMFVGRVLDQLRALPGVSDVGVTHNRFLPGQNLQTIIAIEGAATNAAGNLALDFRRVTPGFFHAVGIRATRGRLFEATDRDSTPPVAIVSQSFVRRYFGATDPLGHRIQRQGGTLPWMTIVGVVPDVMDAGVGVDLGPMVYIPYGQSSSPRVTVVVRSALPVAQVDRAIRAAVHDADASLAIQGIDPLDDLLAESLGQQRLKSVVLASLACLAVLLACTGIYGVTAFLMVDRTHEIAIRMALGADPTAMLGRLIRETSIWTGSGVLVGLVSGWGAGMFWAASLPELREAGATMYVAVAVALVSVSIAAAWGPAYRASRRSPASVLRAQ